MVVGDPKEMICEVTESLHADLLVMGCRSSGAIKSLQFMVIASGLNLMSQLGQLGGFLLDLVVTMFQSRPLQDPNFDIEWTKRGNKKKIAVHFSTSLKCIGKWMNFSCTMNCQNDTVCDAATKAFDMVVAFFSLIFEKL